MGKTQNGGESAHGGESASSGILSWFKKSSHDEPSTSHLADEGGLTFQKIVSYIAAIILAGTLTVIGFIIYRSKTTTQYPPELAECPDYWESTGSNKCRNTLKVGKCDTDEMDFNDPKYSGPTGLAEKCKWANSCGLVWDGLKC